jgi:hypothetical protein
MDNEARSSFENAVILILATNGEARVPALSKAVELSAVVPAARFLANISADRSLVPKLGTRNFASCLRQRPILSTHERVLRNFRNGREGPYPNASISCFFNPFELF